MAKVGQYVRSIAKRSWPDYAVFVGLGIFLSLLREVVNGNQRPFTPGDIEDSGFPYQPDDTVPGWALQTVMWMLPVSSIIVAGVLHMLTPLQAHQHVLSFMIMYILTGVLTNCVKLQIGRPRPSFMHRCFPSTNASDTSFQAIPFSTVSEAMCTNEDQGNIDNAYKSFPSGHASYSASAGMYFTLFLMQMLRVFSGVAPAAHAVIALVPVSLGLWVGLTRIADFEHHPTDVLGGALLGVTIATIFFFQAKAVKRDAHMRVETDGVPSPEPVPVHSVGHGRPVAEAARNGTSNHFQEVSHVGGEELLMGELHAAAETGRSLCADKSTFVAKR